jgi:hypothetical protein
MKRTLSSTAAMAGAAIVAMVGLMAPAASASEYSGYSVEVFVDGRPLTEYPARATTYIEARRGAEYAVRLSNRTHRRVAVALAVDGLNSIDAKTTPARTAAKWVLDPYESIVVEGWQISSESARRFYFTNEADSYGAWLGKTANLGVIEAAFFRERQRDRILEAPDQKREGSSGRSGAPVEPEARGDSARRRSGESFDPDDYAATGIGRRVDNPVRRIRMELEKRPAASIRIRYEYREQLVRLGVLPWPWAPDPLTRREQANGFAPDPYGNGR